MALMRLKSRGERATELLSALVPQADPENRHKAAHPNDPDAMVLQPGGFHRVLGNLLITKAVGDPHSNRPEQGRQQ